jgi:hypothetical protein
MIRGISIGRSKSDAPFTGHLSSGVDGRKTALIVVNAIIAELLLGRYREWGRLFGLIPGGRISKVGFGSLFRRSHSSSRSRRLLLSGRLLFLW